DTWGSLVVKVLPLFNGEGLKLCIEDLNDLVRRCMNDRPLHSLYDDINELLESGMFTLNGKLRGVPDEKLVSRLVELWSFFFGTVIPYFEGV
ncbi:HbrB-like protein, partial [Glomus cerebriforme]